ncbi:MAG: hypothetical protein ABI651_01635, partial [Verrucomicrobiota bacterium]
MKNTKLFLSANALGLSLLSGFAQPAITTQPQPQSANQGFEGKFRTVASGTAPLNYQWYFQSNAISAAITNVLTITNAQPANAGDYFAVVTNASGSVTSHVATLTVILPVSLDPKLGPNIRIGTDPFAKTNLHQAEIHIDRSFKNPNLLLATFQDALASDDGLAASYAVSKDGGLSWASGFIPGVTELNGGALPHAADNVASIDLEGNLFLVAASYSVISGAIGDVSWSVSKSSDGGETFSAPLTLASSDDLSYTEKPWLTANTFEKSPAPGRLVFVSTLYPRTSASGQTQIRYSDDHGLGWSPVRSIGPADAFGSQTFFLPDGTLVVVYRRFPNATSLPNVTAARIELMTSEDGGTTFAAPKLIQDVTGKIYSTWPAIWDSVHFPSACSDRQAGVIYVAYQGFAADNRKSVLFTKSINKGKTWSAPASVNDTPNNFVVFNPAMAVSPDGQHVVIEFYDKRNQTAASAGNYVDLYLAESFDGGDHWEPNIRLTDFSSDLRAAATRDTGSGGGVYLGDYQAIVPSLNFDTPGVATWIDTRAGNNDPYSVRIQRTKGTTFETWRKLRFSTNDLANAAISGENADTDGDGIPNLAEYAFGLEPGHADQSPLRAFRSGPSYSNRI